MNCTNETKTRLRNHTFSYQLYRLNTLYIEYFGYKIIKYPPVRVQTD